MKLYSFSTGDYRSIGVAHRGKLLDLGATHRDNQTSVKANADDAVLMDMLALIRSGEEGLAWVRELLVLADREGTGVSYPLEEVKILAPHRPGKILCSGVNYRGHFTENPAAKMPQHPFFFAKLPSAVTGPGEPIVQPTGVTQLDYEVELALVFGKTCRKVNEDRAMEYIMGYTILHDVSARDVQFTDTQITFGKNYDTFSPLGPCIVTKDEIPHPEYLHLRCLVNGVALQDSTNEDWIYPLAQLISYVSHRMTFEPGDIMTTGTPRGVGFFRDPQVFLKPGDVVVCEIDKIGRLENPVIADEASR